MKRLLVLLASLLASTGAMAQDYPSRPIKLIAPFAAGSGTDIMARILAQELQAETGAVVVVENRPGAFGLIGVNAARNADADGYTLLVSGVSTHALAPYVTKEATYDPVKDFTHLVRTAFFPLTIAVDGSSDYQSIADLTKDIRSNPGKLTYGFTGAAAQLIGATFNKHANLQSVPVPYKSPPEIMSDLVGRRINYVVIDAASASAHMKNGKIKPLVVLSEQRSSLLPGVPTPQEVGLPPMNLLGWNGISGPPGMPDAAKRWLSTHINAVLQKPSLVEKLKNAGAEVSASLAYEDWVRTQYKEWGVAVKEAGMTPQ